MEKPKNLHITLHNVLEMIIASELKNTAMFGVAFSISHPIYIQFPIDAKILHSRLLKAILNCDLIDKAFHLT